MTVGFDPRCSNCDEQLPMGSKHMDPCPKCGTVRLIRRDDAHRQKLKLDYARDRLLIKLCETLRHMPFDCSPAGATILRRKLECAEVVFEQRLDEHYPDPQELT